MGNLLVMGSKAPKISWRAVRSNGYETQLIEYKSKQYKLEAYLFEFGSEDGTRPIIQTNKQKMKQLHFTKSDNKL